MACNLTLVPPPTTEKDVHKLILNVPGKLGLSETKNGNDESASFHAAYSLRPFAGGLIALHGGGETQFYCALIKLPAL